MLEAQIAQGVQLLDLMLEYFSDDGHWARGRYDDGNGGHCLVGAVLHLSLKQERAAAAVKTWLLAQIEKKRRAPSADIADMAPKAPFVLEHLAA